jgi:hypothetical protein
MKFGGKEVLGVYLGDDPADALYLGDELVWSGSWTPAALFANEETGLWYDFSDLSTMFKDDAGNTAAEVDDVVGRVLDKSGNGIHAIQDDNAKRPILRQDEDDNYYLEFDGTDDFLVTASNLALASKTCSIFATVQRPASGFAIYLELSANANSNTYSFYCAAGAEAGFAGFTSKARATTANSLIAATAKNHAADTLALVAIQHDIDGNSTIRVDGEAGTDSTSNKGTSGNFASYPLYIGRRGGTDLAYNGPMYGVVVRGTLTTGDQLTEAEAYLAGKSGVAL